MAHLDRMLRSNIKLRHLQLLVALDQFRHLGRTSEFLSVSQPAVSRMLTEIEAMLGQTLFVRSTRGTAPTAAGIVMVRFARSVLAQYDRTRDEIGAQESGAAGRVRIGAMSVALSPLLADAVDILKAESARATVLIETGDLTGLLPKLRLGETDLFVGRLEPGYAAPDLTTEALYADPMVAVIAPGHALARKRKLRWDDIAELPCVLPPPWASLRVKLEQQFHRHGVQPPGDVIESSSYQATVLFVQRRGAVAFLAAGTARDLERAGALRVLPLSVDVDLPSVGIIALRETVPTAVTARMMDALRSAARAMQRRHATAHRRHAEGSCDAK
ncbi:MULTISPECIES: LysR substrate-binding domain-containing protein [unclassified Achromobacter]|uniref:LysR substrate-binding domain-containing protein n=1 Tax=unclassified Achromobacter TaxID=2626865 RepID=UPI000B517CFC|nr:MULTISPECIES: LysR substrate-binding domain-containing protein [unclassified Achromobacter]OWT73614.1 LysR family transcriptional regulator [Achromobacter sp. HZ34]OWT79469.1 LysR family transcriptional regulator [Achromobacter sp. HZ28]